MGHRAYIPHIVRKGALHLGCASDLAYPHWGPDAFSYDLTTVGSQESGRLFALSSVLFSYGSRMKSLTAVLFFEKSCVCSWGITSGSSLAPIGGIIGFFLWWMYRQNLVISLVLGVTSVL